ncbi:MAG: polysaccharide deacetylase family protein, partial [Chitinophagales bacterium]
MNFNFTALKNKLKTTWWNANSGFVSFKTSSIGNSIIIIYHGIVPKQHLKYNFRFATVSNFKEQLTLLKNAFNIVTVNDIYNNDLATDRLNVAITFDDGFKNNLEYAAPILNDLNLPATFYITTIRAAGYDYLWPDFLDIVSYYAKEKIKVGGMEFQKHGNEFIHNGLTLKNYCRQSPWPVKEEMFEALKHLEPCLDINGNKAYWELLTEVEIRQLSENKLFDIGSHGFYHNNLASIN